MMAGAGSKPVSPARKSGVVVPHSPRWFQRLAAWILYVLATAYALTLRKRWVSGRDSFPGNGPVIFCLWHNRLSLCMEVYRRQIPRPANVPGLAALISASKDGALLAAILERFQVQPVRGSSSRRGAQALLELTSWADRRYDLAITPDGPRGPCYRVQEGVMSLAQLTGLPIVPFGFHASRKFQLKSWDRFQIPLPFSRCDFRLGKPIYVPRDLTEAQREALRLQLEAALREISPD